MGVFCKIRKKIGEYDFEHFPKTLILMIEQNHCTFAYISWNFEHWSPCPRDMKEFYIVHLSRTTCLEGRHKPSRVHGEAFHVPGYNGPMSGFQNTAPFKWPTAHGMPHVRIASFGSWACFRKTPMATNSYLLGKRRQPQLDLCPNCLFSCFPGLFRDRQSFNLETRD